ncbi:GNAT family protein [Streptomyces sp. NPDC019937]|uniref:GNAT family N-acetyltransferase n=1 Tax=Streptomyces sp. NPDC019937 TaxID=3154787 RepID=UPI0033F3CFC5
MSAPAQESSYTEGQPVMLERKDLRLREFTSADVDSVLRIFGDPRTTLHFGMTPFQQSEAAQLVEQAAESARQRPRTQFRLAVSQISTDELIATVKLFVAPPSEGAIVQVGHRSAEFGCAFRPDKTHKGLSVEVGLLMGAFAFGQLGLHRIWAGFMPSNVAARRAAEKSGLTHEGVLRDYCWADGKWHDLTIYSVLATEWQQSPPNTLPGTRSGARAAQP